MLWDKHLRESHPPFLQMWGNRANHVKCHPLTCFSVFSITPRQFSDQNLLNCDEKVELADEESEETFEEALEDEPNDKNVRFDDD